MSTSADAQRVVQELTAAGVPVSNVYDLVNTDDPYPAAIPVLLRMLDSGMTDVRTVEGVVRALGVREARGIAARPLIQAFRSAPGPGWTLKWAIGNSLHTVAEAEHVPELLELVRDASHGRGREMLVATLGKFDTSETRAAVLALLQADDLTLHAIEAAGKLRLSESRSLLVRYLDDERAPVRKAAGRALAMIDKVPSARRRS